MGGQVQQSSGGSHYDHRGGIFSDSQRGDSIDSAMARWLQYAGLQQLGSPTMSHSVNHSVLPNLLPQDYAKHGNLEDRKKLFQLIRSISGGIEPASEPFTPPVYGSGRRDGVSGPLSSPELRGEIGGGILDLHLIDDTELFSEDGMHEPFEVSPFVAIAERESENESEVLSSCNKTSKQCLQNGHNPIKVPGFEKEVSAQDILASLARIKVVVRKRPLNKKELARKEDDIVTIDNNGFSLSVHEPKLKVDLTAYVEKHDFVFDAVLDDQVSNDEVYRVTVEPIVPAIFQRTKATCFAYGQTGSGKTFTMQPIPLRACQDMLDLMHHPKYMNQGLQLWLSFFEIYGGKLYDLLTDRRKLCMREDGRQQVCIVGLKEFPVSNVESVKEYIEKGNASRSTGSTGANEESSRSHAILQLVIKKHSNKKDERSGKLVGKFSFIDLAGSERGADTTDNDRQTRIEGAEINKSLLALKECIRALDHEQGHIPFRGSKLTEVLRDSFVGDSRTVMISCISPNTGSCEHTLNTLRYADRVKGLSKNNNSKRDPCSYTGVQIQKDTTVAFPSISAEMSNSNCLSVAEPMKETVEQLSSEMEVVEGDVRTYQGVINQHDGTPSSSINDSGQLIVKEGVPIFNYQQDDPTGKTEQDRSKVEVVKADRYESALSNDDSARLNTLRRATSQKDEPHVSRSQLGSKDPEIMSQTGYNVHINAILEEEEDLIATHRLTVEDTMDLVREEMKLLTAVDLPGSRIDLYVSQLSCLLARKASGIINLQAQLARFQRRLEEHGILSQNVD